MTTKSILSNAFVVSYQSDRLDQFRRSFEAVGLDHTLVRVWDSTVIPGEGTLGNSVSQYSLVRFAKASKMPFLVVFEDDAVPCDNAPEELVKAFDTKPEDCLCLSLGWSASLLEGRDEEWRKRGDHGRVYGSHAYVLFGEKAYDEYLSKWVENGRADYVLQNMSGSYMGKKPMFAQHTVGESIHLPGGWVVDTEAEKTVDQEVAARYLKVRAALSVNTIHVAYCVDVPNRGGEQFIDQLVVSLHTLKSYRGKDDHIKAHVFYGNVPPTLIERVYKMGCDGFDVETHELPCDLLRLLQKYADPADPNGSRSWTGIVYARLWLPALLPSVGRVIYLDADTMVRGSVKELYNTDLGDAFFGMVKGTIPEYGYNSGVMVVDLDNMRKDTERAAKLVPYMEMYARSFRCPDQTLINRFYGDKIKELPLKWNYGPGSGIHGDPNLFNAVVLHFYNSPQKPYRLDADDLGASILKWNEELKGAERSTT